MIVCHLQTNHSKHFGRISPIPLNFDETILEHPPETQNRQPIPRNVMNWDKDPFLRLRPINELPDDVWEGPPEWFVQAEQRVREAEKAKECTTDDDFDAFPLLQVINSEYIRYRYGEIETVFAVKPRRKQQRILRDSKSKLWGKLFLMSCRPTATFPPPPIVCRLPWRRCMLLILSSQSIVYAPTRVVLC